MSTTPTPKKAPKRLSTRDAVISLLIIGTIVASPVEYVAWTAVRARQFYARLDTIKFGMSQSEIESAFRRPADYVCAVGACKVLYISRRALGDAHPKSIPDSVENHKDLQFVYGAGQFLLDPGGKLVAYSVIGEELYVHTRDGDFQGSSIQDLDDNVFDNLTKSARG